MSYITDNTAGPPIPRSDLPEATDFHKGLPADIKAKIWSEVVKRDAREKNIFRDFMGEEGSGKPICTKRDLAAGGADNVRFTTTTPIRGQGVIGEGQLKGNTDRLRFGSFDVKVDLIRHGLSHTQVLKLLKFTGKTVDELSSELMSEWAARKQQDDCMIAFRNTALDAGLNGVGVNVHRFGNKDVLSSSSDLVSADVAATEEFEVSKQKLITNGAMPMANDTDVSGADIPQFLFFGPDTLLKPLRNDDKYLLALRYSKERGDSNPQFKGSYPIWDNNMFHIHNIVVDTAQGRQGSPLAPRAYLGQEQATITTGSGAIVLKGGGTAYGALDEELDYFANFTGFPWHFTTDDELDIVMPVGGKTDTEIKTNRDTQDHYATAYDLFTHNYFVIRYRRGGFSAKGNTLTAEEVVKIGNAAGGSPANVTLPAGAIIYQSNKEGIPVEYGLHLGGNALYYAVGSIENQPIYHYDDFATADNVAHLNGVGIQTVRGLRAYQDTIGRLPNYILAVGVADIPGVQIEVT